MAITRRGTQIFKLAADAKPTAANVQAGTELINTDDSKHWVNSGTEWIPQDFPALKKFNVFVEGSKTYVTDIHDKVQGSATETEDAINPIMAAQPNTSIYLWIWDADTFTLFSPLIFPTHSSGVLKKNIHRTEAWSTMRSTTGGVTTLMPDASFPTNRYLFEANNPIGSGTTSSVEISGFQGVNSSNFTTLNCGFVKLESEVPNNYHNWIVRDCYLNYMWRGIHLIGYIWYGKFENIFVSISNTGFSGDAPFKLEDGGHTHINNPTPKSNVFRNIQSNSGDGVYQAFLDMKSGGYNLFDHVFVDGKFYDLAAFYLNNTDTLTLHNNTFNDLITLDLEVSPSVTTHGSLYMAGGSVFDNIFKNCRFSLYSSKMIKLEGTGVMNNYIQADSYWGGQTLTVTHFTPGENNVVEVIAAAKTTAGQLPVSLTGGTTNRVKVIDKRKGADNGGIATTRTDGSTIAHGLFAAPAWYFVTGTVAGEIVTATADATNLTLGIKTHAGAAGTSQSVAWRAGVYA